MVHFDARLDTWAHVRSPGCGSRVVLYVSILQLAHELLAPISALGTRVQEQEPASPREPRESRERGSPAPRKPREPRERGG